MGFWVWFWGFDGGRSGGFAVLRMLVLLVPQILAVMLHGLRLLVVRMVLVQTLVVEPVLCNLAEALVLVGRSGPKEGPGHRGGESPYCDAGRALAGEEKGRCWWFAAI